MIRKAENEREGIIEHKVRGCMRRARKDWNLHGEKPSKYYLGLESHNYKRKNRFTIRNQEGKLMTGIKNILQEQHKFYRALYSEPNQVQNLGTKFEKFTAAFTIPMVTQEHREMLDSEFTLSELSKAISETKTGKIPGSDGLGIELYVKFYKEIKELLLETCQIASVNGLHNTAKQGIITLIEKPGKDLTNLACWRPLSLLNSDGKLYAKILANRLEIVNSYLIHTDQSGFQKGRSTHDNLMDLLSVMDYAEYNNLPLLLISFDFEKAFDKVAWNYIDLVLKKFGFGDRFRTMVQNAHHGTTSCR